MKNWLKLAIGATTLAAFATQAQTAEERRTLRKPLEVEALSMLADDFQAKFDASAPLVSPFSLLQGKRANVFVER